MIFIFSEEKLLNTPRASSVVLAQHDWGFQYCLVTAALHSPSPWGFIQNFNETAVRNNNKQFWPSTHPGHRVNVFIAQPQTTLVNNRETLNWPKITKPPRCTVLQHFNIQNNKNLPAILGPDLWSNPVGKKWEKIRPEPFLQTVPGKDVATLQNLPWRSELTRLSSTRLSEWVFHGQSMNFLSTRLAVFRIYVVRL